MSRRLPGSLLWHPAVVLSAAIILLNMSILKVDFPGWWSGKLSDFALCVFLPIWLYSLFEWSTWTIARLRSRRWRVPTGHLPATLCCAIAGAYFVALQIWPAWADFHVAWLSRLVPGRFFAVTPDLTDLIALPFLSIAYALIVTRKPATQRSSPERHVQDHHDHKTDE